MTTLLWRYRKLHRPFRPLTINITMISNYHTLKECCHERTSLFRPSGIPALTGLISLVLIDDARLITLLQNKIL